MGWVPISNGNDGVNKGMPRWRFDRPGSGFLNSDPQPVVPGLDRVSFKKIPVNPIHPGSIRSKGFRTRVVFEHPSQQWRIFWLEGKTMEWFFWPFVKLLAILRPLTSGKRAYSVKAKEKTPISTTRKRRRKVPFYSQIPTTRISLYQAYINRAFQLSPTLEFEKNDLRFHGLLTEAARSDALNQLDLELMRIQFVLADKRSREQYRDCWAVKVVNRRQDDFFPSPWTILTAFFSEHAQERYSAHKYPIQ